MPGPSRYNRRLKARNDRRKSSSGGGRTRSEAGLGRSMRASGRRVSRTNTRATAPSPPRATRTRSERTLRRNLGINRERKRAKVNPLATRQTAEAVDRLRKKYGVSMGVNRREEALENTAVDSLGLRRTRKFLAEGDKARTGGAANVERAIRKTRDNTDLNRDGMTAKSFLGAEVVGKIPARDVRTAAQQGQLRLEKGNKVTTPEVRRVQRKAKRVKKRIAKLKRRAGARVDGPLTPGQKKFVQEFSKRTGINPRVAGAWVLSEMSDSFATQREAEGNHNWLNIAYFDSGPGSITKDPVWSSPTSAAKASAQFLRGERFGASQGIRNILPQAKGRSDEEQIQAIAGSGWASSGYEGGNSLRRTRDLISARPANPKAKARLRQLQGRARGINRQAKELGIEGVAKTQPKIAKPRRATGDWAGSQRIIQRILGAGPGLASDKEARGTGSYHDTSNEVAYAQDIPISGGLEQGEPLYNQKLLDKITRRIRRMGGQVPDLEMGMGYVKGSLRGYELEIIPDSLTNSHGTGPHLHIGAKWVGENLPPGTQLGGSGSAPAGGSGGGGTTVTSIGPSGVQTVQYKGKKKKFKDILLDLGFRVTPGGVRKVGGGRAFAVGSQSKSSEGEVLKALKREYKL